MHCTNCGIQLPDEALFCDECGAHQRSREERDQAPRLSDAVAAPPTAPAVQEEWEHCESVFRETPWRREFVAQVMGPEGLHNVLTVGAGFGAPKHGRRTGKIIEGMVSKLMADGWEPEAKGNAWYNHRFRHRVS